MSGLRRLFSDHVAQTSENPLGLEVSHASGVYIYGTDGRQYLDFDSGYSVSSLGHCHPEVVGAVKEQSAKYMHTSVYGEHIQAPQVEYASLLTSLLADSLDCVYFVNSGSEAVEAAIKLARKYTGRPGVISCTSAYHGSTTGAESLRSDHTFSMFFAPLLPGVTHIDFNEEAHLDRITHDTACVILEPVQAEAGVIPPQNDYLQKVRQRCDETGTLMVLDEIQTGFGRTGNLFAHQKYGVTPDVLLIAKAMGGGMPVGALVAGKNVLGAFVRNPALGHITTFGGHPVCIAAALAALQVLLRDPWIAEVSKKEALVHSTLVHPLIREVRSSGLLMAIELIHPHYLVPVIQAIIRQGVLTDYFLFNETSFRIAPPLVISEKDLSEGLSRILRALDEVLNIMSSDLALAPNIKT